MPEVAESAKVSAGGSKWLDIADHPLVFSFAIFLMVVAWAAIMSALFAALGWTGPLALFKHP